MSTHVDNMECEDIIRIKKIKLNPTKKQQYIMKEWFNTSRFVYNRVLNDIKINNSKLDFYKLRNKFVIAKNNNLINDWEERTPKDIRAWNVKEVVTSYKQAFTNLKNNNINSFSISYRKKNKNPPCLSIPKTSIKIKNEKMFIYTSRIKNHIKFFNKKDLKYIKQINNDSKLQYKNNNWYLHVLVKDKIKNNFKYDNVGIDPGQKTFLTGFSNDVFFKINHNQKRLDNLKYLMFKNQSQRDKKEINKKTYLKKFNKLNLTYNNLIDELHYKSIVYLKDFKKILFTEF